MPGADSNRLCQTFIVIVFLAIFTYSLPSRDGLLPALFAIHTATLFSWFSQDPKKVCQDFEWLPGAESNRTAVLRFG